jgi:hypothetical protein
LHKNVRAAAAFIPLIIFTAISTIAQGVLALHHLRMPEESDYLWSISLQLMIACWVRIDRRDRCLRLPFEFDAFVSFAWPLVLPYYLYESRGARGVLLAVSIFALLIIPNVAALTLPTVHTIP